MFRRLWPALGLAGALLLAATSLPAVEDSQVSVQPQKVRGSSWRIPTPSPDPVASPADPGDDDMPSRGGNIGPKLPQSSGVQGMAEGRDSRGSRLHDLVAALRLHWVRLLTTMR